MKYNSNLHQEPATVSTSLEVCVINLRTAEERRRLISAQFANLPYPWSFFEAHTSLRNSSLHHDEQQTLRTYGKPFSPAQLAVWSSHVAAIERFLVHSPHDYLLIFEDDVLFDTAFPLQKLAEFRHAQAIHYIRPYGMYDAKAVKLSYFFDRSIIRHTTSAAGAQARGLVHKFGFVDVYENARSHMFKHGLTLAIRLADHIKVKLAGKIRRKVGNLAMTFTHAVIFASMCVLELCWPAAI